MPSPHPPWSNLTPSNHPQATLTPPPPPADRAARRTRHLRQCERLAEIAMELTEAARGEALKEFQPPAPRRSYPAHTIPGLSLPEPPPFARTTTFNDLVMQLSRCVRQAILLEYRIDSGAFNHPPPQTPDRDTAPRTPQAPQRPSDQTRIAHERLEDDSAANPARLPSEIIASLAAELAAILDSGALPPCPAPAAHTPAAATPRRAPDAPPNAQARARRHVLQQSTAPPPSG